MSLNTRLRAAAFGVAVLIFSPVYAGPSCGLYQYKATVVRVVDGDTVRADIDLGFNTWRRNEPLRLEGIDAPEPRGETREAGRAASDALAKRVEGQKLIICTIKDTTGKFGRYLVQLWLGDENINAWMLKAGHAVPYE